MRPHLVCALAAARARRALRAGVYAVLGLLVFLPYPARAADPKERTPVAKVLNGTVLAREQVEKPWRVLDDGKSVPSGDMLVGISGTTLESKNRAVRLTFLGDLDETSPFPVIETAVSLRPSNDFDLDFTLNRGRIDLINHKDKGAAMVRVRFLKKSWDLTLDEPGTRVALEIYGRWPPGSRYEPNAKQERSPVINFVMVVLKGQVDRKCPVCQIAMKAPPGPALFEWDSVNGEDICAHRLDKLPEWTKPPDPDSEKVKLKKEKLEKLRKIVVNDSVDAALKQFIHSDDANERKLGIYAAGALDQLNYVAEVLQESKHPDAWHNSVVAIRHWLGRGPGQDAILYNRLIKLRNYSPAEAKTTIQLLHGFTEVQAAQPELYEVLINLVKNDKLAIRGLAHWHLQRLAPLVKVEFNPASEKEEWEKAAAAWKKAIPKGNLPPTLKDVEKESRKQ